MGDGLEGGEKAWLRSENRTYLPGIVAVDVSGISGIGTSAETMSKTIEERANSIRWVSSETRARIYSGSDVKGGRGYREIWSSSNEVYMGGGLSLAQPQDSFENLGQLSSSA